MQIKTTMSYCYTTFTTVNIIKIGTTPNASKDLEKLDSSHITVGMLCGLTTSSLKTPNIPHHCEYTKTTEFTL